MASGSVCSKCGFSNQPGFQFCTNCGSALAVGGAPMAAPTPAFAGPVAMPPFAYGPPPWEMERRKQIDRTKTGILLLLIGSLLSWIPLVLFVGYLLLLIGAILVIMGRRAFGPTHSRNVIVSLVLFIVGIVGSFVLGLMFALTLFSISPGSSIVEIVAAIRSAFNTLLIGAIVVGAVSSIGSVLFTYALQNQTGRVLLFAGYGANLAIQIATFAIVLPILDQFLADVLSTGVVDEFALAALQTQATGLGLLAVIPAVIFSLADFIAWSRINRGEIPPPPAPVPPLYGSPPGPPGSGQVPPGAPPPIHPQ